MAAAARGGHSAASRIWSNNFILWNKEERMTNRTSVVLKINNQKVREEFNGIISSLEGFRLLPADESKACDLLVMEVGDDIDREFKFLRELRESGRIKDVVLTSSSTDPDILMRALRAGAKEFFPQPLNKEELLLAFSKFKKNGKQKDEPAKKTGKIINIVGSKGGIGTTTAAVNTATSLLNLPGVRSVALIDMNLLFGEVPLFLDIEPAFNWGEIANNISRLDSTYLMSVLSTHPSGIHVLPSPTALDGINAASPEVIEKLLDVMKTEFDFIVIDSGQSLDAVSLRILELSDSVLVNAILSLPCLINVKRLLDMFGRLGFPKEEQVKIMISRYHKNSAIAREEAEKGMGKRIFWSVPNDFQATIRQSIRKMLCCGPKVVRNFGELATK
jgi:pilus assembly protein CpaE